MNPGLTFHQLHCNLLILFYSIACQSQVQKVTQVKGHLCPCYFSSIDGRIRLPFSAAVYRGAPHSDRASTYLRSTASGFKSAYGDVEISFIALAWKTQRARGFYADNTVLITIAAGARDKNYSPLSHLVGIWSERQTAIRVSKPFFLRLPAALRRTNTEPRRLSPRDAVDTRTNDTHANDTFTNDSG